MTNFIHGIEVKTSTDVLPTIRTNSPSVIGLVGTCSDAPSNQGEGLYLVDSPKKAKNFKGTGTVPLALGSIFAQANARVIVKVVSDENKIAQGIGDLKKAKTLLDLKPNILIAPLSYAVFSGEIADNPRDIFPDAERTDDTNIDTNIDTNTDSASDADDMDGTNTDTNTDSASDADDMDGTNTDTNTDMGDRAPDAIKEHQRLSIARKLLSVAKSLRAVAVVDVNYNPKLTRQEFKSLEGDGSERLFLCYPYVKNIAEAKVALSPSIAGLIAKTDNELGWWVSPSNKLFSGITGLETMVDYVDDDPTCTASKLNSLNVSTLIRDGGFRLWGNRTYFTDSSKDFKYLTAVRTMDVLVEALKKNLRWAIDRNITKDLTTEILAVTNNFISELISKGAILGGKCSVDWESSDPTDGKLAFLFSFSPNTIAEHITFDVQLTDKYLKEVLSDNT